MICRTKGHLQGGLTLIELLVVVAIIGIIGAIGFPMFAGQKTLAEETDAKNTLRVISAAQERYKLLNGTYYPNASGAINNPALISSALLNNQALNTRIFSYSVQTIGCQAQPVTGIARNFCITATRINNSNITFTIDHTDKIYNRSNVEVQ